MFLVLSISRFDCKITTDSKTREWGQFTENHLTLSTTSGYLEPILNRINMAL